MRASSVRSLKTLALLVLFAAGVIAGWRFRPVDRPIFADDQLYFYVAERAASGVPPHVSLVDHKHQLAPLISAAAIAVGRVFGADDVLAGRIVSILAAAAVVPLLGLLAAALTGSFAAGLAAAACTLTLKMFFIEAATGFRPQLFMTFFAVAALLAFARDRRAAAGALAAAAFLSWQPAAVICVALAIAAAFEARPARAVARVVVGGAAIVLAYEAYFAVNGALGEQLYQSYFMGKLLRVPPFTKTLLFFVRGDPTEVRWRPDALFGGIFLAALAGAWLWALVRPRAAWAAWKQSAAWRAVFLAAHGAVAYTFLDHQAYPDRFFLLPYIVLTAACAVGIVPRLIARIPARAIAAAALSAWMITFVPGLGRASNRSGGTLEQQRAIAQRVVEIGDARGGGLWVVGRPDLLALAHRTNWNGFGMLLDANVRAYAQRSSGSRGAYRPMRDGEMPDMVLVARVSARIHLPWLFHEYEKVAFDDLAGLHAQIFVKRSRLTGAERRDARREGPARARRGPARAPTKRGAVRPEVR
jgi:hypothetical protein